MLQNKILIKKSGKNNKELIMDVNELFTKGRATNIANIANAIENNKVSSEEFAKILKRVEVEDYYTNKTFNGKPKSEWNQDYLSELQMHCIEWFCEDYLKELFNVSKYVHSERISSNSTNNNNFLKWIIAGGIIFLIIILIITCGGRK